MILLLFRECFSISFNCSSIFSFIWFELVFRFLIFTHFFLFYSVFKGLEEITRWEINVLFWIYIYIYIYISTFLSIIYYILLYYILNNLFNDVFDIKKEIRKTYSLNKNISLSLQKLRQYDKNLSKQKTKINIAISAN